MRRVITSIAMLDVDLQRPLQAEQARLAVDQGQHVDAEGGLQRRVLEKLIEHLARVPRRA